MQMVNIQLHGNLFTEMKSKYRLAVTSVGEAVHAINTITKQRFYKQLLENDKKGIKYEVLINKRKCLFEKKPDCGNLETIKNSELTQDIHNLQDIDIVPVIEGADSDIGLIIVGAVLIIAGAILINPTLAGFGFKAMGTFGAGLVFAGIGLVAAGVINLLSTPPRLDDFQNTGRKGSYLFNGVQNTVGEGGPVPVLYGRLLVGSQTILVNQNIADQTAVDTVTV